MTPRLRALLSPFRYVENPDGSYRILRLLDKTQTAVIVPEGVSSIAAYAFEHAKALQKIYLPTTLTEIGANAFLGCTALSDVHISDLLRYIEIDFEDSSATPGSFARRFFLNGSPVTHFDLPSGTTEIKKFAFQGMATLKSITLPEGLLSIGSDAFLNCGIEALTLPDSLRSIGSYAFADNKALRSVRLPKTLTALPSGIFSSCTSLKTLSLPRGITRIESSSLSHSGIETLTVPEGVDYIGESAFRHCTELCEITLPSTLLRLGDYAFYQCEQIKTLKLTGALSAIGHYAFAYCTALETLSLPQNELDVGRNIILECTSLQSFVMKGALLCGGVLYKTIPYTDTLGDYRLSSDAIAQLALTPLLDQIALFSLDINRTRYIDGEERGRSHLTRRLADEESLRTLVVREGIIVGAMTTDFFLPVGIETETYYGEDNNGAGTKALSEKMTLTFHKGRSAV